MKTGIYGGSFNPIHLGHIRLAESIKNELGLDRIIFVPSGVSPHRSMNEYASADDRYNMISLVCEGREGFEVSRYETDSENVSYTIYTVEHFREIYPEDELYLLVGSDMLLIFEKWFRFEDILKNVTLVAASRNGSDMDILRAKAEELSEFGRIEIVNSEPIEVSSTEIREKIEKNSDLSCYLDENVVQYIRMRGLYCHKK